jgi:MFS family permease
VNEASEGGSAPLPSGSATVYPWFLTGVASWALASGLQQVLFAWLLVGELHESGAHVGLAQMCLMLPSLLFLLPGGLLADRSDLRRLLRALHVLAAVAALGLALAVGLGQLSLPLLIGYALLWGTLQALAGPARDAFVSHLGAVDLLRAITWMTAVQFLSMAAGARLGGVGSWLGSVPVLALQAGILLTGLVPLVRLPRTAPHPRTREDARSLVSLASALGTVRRSPRLLPVALLVAANGLFYMGPAQVLCPLIVRDVYHGDLSELSTMMMVLPLGTIAGSLWVLWRGGLRRKGRAFLLALLGVAAVLIAFLLRPPFAGFIALMFVWGVCHSLFFNTSRALFQAAAPASHRAQVLAVHSLGLLGMAPLSNLAAGFLAEAVGPVAACALAGAAMIIITTLAWLLTPVRRFE